MKKIILSLILALIVIFSCVSPAFAADSGEWVLHGSGAEYITHNGKKYLPIFDINTSNYNLYGYEIDYDIFYVQDLEFDSPATESIYYGASVTLYSISGYSYIDVYLPRVGPVLYVAEEYMDKFTDLRSGLFSKNYVLKTEYDVELEMNLPDEHSFVTIPVSISKISDTYFEWVDLYSYDPDKGLSVLSGAILRSRYEDDVYLLRYTEFDSSYFYADGRFAQLDSGKLYNVHLITDEEAIETLDRLIDARPDDELDWIVGSEPSKVKKIISSIFFFGIVPVAIIVFCAVMLKKSKKKMYRAPLIVLLSSAALLLISAIMLYH